MKLNDFKQDLKFSEAASDEDFWTEIYRQAFPDMMFSQTVKGNCQAQHLGIDRVIQLKSGKTLYIDEKKRRKKYGDILLEYQSNSNSGKHDGWMNKGLLIDYIAYAFMDEKQVFLFDWLTLRRIWWQHGKSWFEKAKLNQDGFRIVIADNKIYQTKSLAVPIKTLLIHMVRPIIITQEAA